MCRDWTGDHEIMADEMEDYIEWRKQYHEPIADEFDAQENARESYKDALAEHNDEGPQPIEFTDEELEDMNRKWQESMRGCVQNLPNIDDVIRHNRSL